MNIFGNDVFTAKSETNYLTEDTTIRQALEKFDYHKFSVVPIIDSEGAYVTTVSEGDILRYIKNQAHFDITQAENTLILQIEKYRPYKACRHDVSEEEIYKLALEQNFVPIVDDRGLFIGIIKRKNILNLFIRKE
ncbi:MAG: CBS domain-containing protein [Bacillota bacterium]|nr:CBS domain-containing protein [Bacillota bacterium]